MAIHATSLKLPSELKARIESAAEAAGTSAHAFMVKALERETARAEHYAKFVAEAKAADQEFERTGAYHDASDVFSYLMDVSENQPRRKPKPKKWRR